MNDSWRIKCTDAKGELFAKCVCVSAPCNACIGFKGEECLAVSRCKNDFVFDKKGGGGPAVVWRQKDLKLSPSDCDCQVQGRGHYISESLLSSP